MSKDKFYLVMCVGRGIGNFNINKYRLSIYKIKIYRYNINKGE